MAAQRIQLVNVDAMTPDESDAVYQAAKIKIAPAIEMRRTVALLLNSALDPAIGINHTTSKGLRGTLMDGSFAIWTVGGHFSAIYDILAADVDNFQAGTVGDLMSQYPLSDVPTNAQFRTPNATTRLLSLFIAFTCLAKGNASRSALNQQGRFVENEGIRRRYTAMVAQKNLPGDSVVGPLLGYLPAGCMEACQAALWRNAQVAQMMISWALTATPNLEADRALTSQLKLLYEGAEMTFTKVSSDFLTLCDSQLKLLPRVVSEAEQFLQVKEELQHKHGDHMLHLRLYRHPDADRLSPRLYPFLAGAAYYWLNQKNLGSKPGGLQPINVVEANTAQGGYSQAEMMAAHAQQIPQNLRATALGTTLSPRFCAATGLQAGTTAAQARGQTAATNSTLQLVNLLARALNLPSP